MPLGTGNVTFLQVSPYVQKENADIHQNPPAYLNGQGWGVNQSFQNSSATAEGRKIHISISVLIRFILRWIIPL